MAAKPIIYSYYGLLFYNEGEFTMTNYAKYIAVIGITVMMSIFLVSCSVIQKPDNFSDAEKFIIGEWETSQGYFVIKSDKTFSAYRGDAENASNLMMSGTYICQPIFVAGSGFSENVEETGVELKFTASDMYNKDGTKISDEELISTVNSNLLFWVFPVEVFNKRYARELTAPAEGPYVFDYQYGGYMNAKKVK